MSEEIANELKEQIGTWMQEAVMTTTEDKLQETQGKLLAYRKVLALIDLKTE